MIEPLVAAEHFSRSSAKTDFVGGMENRRRWVDTRRSVLGLLLVPPFRSFARLKPEGRRGVESRLARVFCTSVDNGTGSLGYVATNGVRTPSDLPEPN